VKGFDVVSEFRSTMNDFAEESHSFVRGDAESSEEGFLDEREERLGEGGKEGSFRALYLLEDLPKELGRQSREVIDVLAREKNNDK
jgi:hypothetical protein